MVTLNDFKHDQTLGGFFKNSVAGRTMSQPEVLISLGPNPHLSNHMNMLLNMVKWSSQM